MKENQFLKLVIEFVSTYLNECQQFFEKDQLQHLRHILSYCQPSFQHVDTWKGGNEIPYVKNNVFFREYAEATKIGSYILKRFSNNISKVNITQTSTPPFWLDMSKLFELYVFEKLKKIFPSPGMISYHDNFKGGKQTDILIRAEGYKCVVDCKYKPKYKNQDPSLDDKRQLAGYTRLKSVYNKLDISHEKVIKGLIIYSDQEVDQKFNTENLFVTPIGEYIDFYKAGIKLPIISSVI